MPMDHGYEPREVEVSIWAFYVGAAVLGPLACLTLWLAAFGSRGVQLDEPGAIAGLLALATPPAIGVVLGWRMPLVEGSRNRTLLAASVPVMLVAFPLLIVAAGNYVALFALAVVYAVGPVLLGRFLWLAWATIRRRGG
jgi:hypothetical protein